MKHFLSLITLTTVYFFSAGAMGDQTITEICKNDPEKCQKMERNLFESLKCAEKFPDASSSNYKQCLMDAGVNVDPCKELAKNATEKMDKLTEICGKARMGNLQQCKEKAEECQNMEDDNADGVDQITAGAGVASFTKKCPSSTDQPKTIKTDLKDKQKELAELKKDIVKDEKDAADSFEKLQKEISDLQEEYDKKNLDLSAEERKRRADKIKALQDLTAAIEANNASILEAQATLAGLEGKKAENLSNLSEAIIQTDCESAVIKLAESLKISGSGSSGGMIKQGAKKNQNLKLRYAQCIEAKNQARKSIINASEKETEKINFSIERLKADTTRKQQTLTQMQADDAKDLADAKAGKDVAAQKFAADKQRLTNKLQNLMTSTQKQQSNNQTRLAQLTGDVNKLSNELAMIGGGTITVNATFSEAISARSSYNTAIKNWGGTCNARAADTDPLKKAYKDAGNDTSN